MILYIKGVPGGSWGGVDHAVHPDHRDAKWTTARCGAHVQVARKPTTGANILWEDGTIMSCRNCSRLIKRDKAKEQSDAA